VVEVVQLSLLELDLLVAAGGGGGEILGLEVQVIHLLQVHLKEIMVVMQQVLVSICCRWWRSWCCWW
jgi:hypothetical protein